jgi:hypothetical protein
MGVTEEVTYAVVAALKSIDTILDSVQPQAKRAVLEDVIIALQVLLDKRDKEKNVTFYRRIKGESVMCRAVTLTGAQREATAEYLWALRNADAVAEILGEDKNTVLSARTGINGKWEK